VCVYIADLKRTESPASGAVIHPEIGGQESRRRQNGEREKLVRKDTKKSDFTNSVMTPTNLWFFQW
jgi:hypothetical protein